MRFLKALKALILNTLFPPVCVSCKREGDFLCMDCLKNLDKKKISPNYRNTYLNTNLNTDFHDLDGVIYALDYAKNPQIQAAIKQLKYRFTQDLAMHFGRLIAEKIGELSMAKGRQIILIPVPLHKKRLNYRGFNQAQVIAQAVADKIPNAQILPLLDRVRHTQQQAKLSKDERHENLKDAFEMNTNCVQQYFSFARAYNTPSFGVSGYEERRAQKKTKAKEKGEERRGSLLFLVDDVCTTGSTLENCARVLKDNGFEKVYGLVIARAFK